MGKAETVEVTENMKLYINDDLHNAAHYFKKRIEKRAAKKDDQHGLGLEVMACVILLAFTVEAHFNFLGYNLVPDWEKKERGKALDKVHAVLATLNADNDLTQPPYEIIKKQEATQLILNLA